MTDDEARASDLAIAKSLAGKLCSDCPPVGYPADKTRCLPCPRRTPKALDDVADIVLAYKPKPKAEAAKKRQRKARKIERDKAK